MRIMVEENRNRRRETARARRSERVGARDGGEEPADLEEKGPAEREREREREIAS